MGDGNLKKVTPTKPVSRQGGGGRGQDGSLKENTLTKRDVGKTRMDIPRGEDGGLGEVTETEGVPKIKGRRGEDGALRRITETKKGINLDRRSANVKPGHDGGLQDVTMTHADIDRSSGGSRIGTDRMSDGGLRFGPAGNFKTPGQHDPGSLPKRSASLGLDRDAETAYLGHFANESVLKAGHNKNWIAGAIQHPGALHHQLGVPEGEKIPAGKLAAAAEKGGTLGKRARLAETLKGFHK